MTPALKAVFAECKKPAHVCRKDVNAQLGPILALAARAQQQMAVHRQNLLKAELTADEPDLVRGLLERLHQTAGAVDREAKVVIDAGRAMSLSFDQMERYSAEIEAALAKRAP